MSSKESQKRWREANKEYLRVKRHEHYLKTKDRHRVYTREHQRNKRNKDKLENPCLFILRRTRQSARNRGLEFNLELEDIVIPDRCPILDVPLVIREGRAKFDTPTVDRVDNSKGYVKGNVAVISHRANRLKSNLTKEQIQNLYKYISERTQRESFFVRP